MARTTTHLGKSNVCARHTNPVVNSRCTTKKWDPATEQELKPLAKDLKALPLPSPVCAWRTSDLWTDGRHPSTSYEG